MAPGHEIYIPVSIPLWGIIEPDHLHLNNHLNFIFHAHEGKIIGAAIYPVRNMFQVTVVGSAVNVRGAAKWFDSHSFKDFTPGSFLATSSSLKVISSTIFMVLIWSTLTLVLSATGFTYLYQNYLRPRVLKTFLKKD